MEATSSTILVEPVGRGESVPMPRAPGVTGPCALPVPQRACHDRSMAEPPTVRSPFSAPVGLANSQRGGVSSEESARVADAGILLGLELHLAISPHERDRAVGHPVAPAAEPTSVGEIIDTLTIGDERYVLVDTTHWTFGSRRLLPISAIERIDLPGRACFTSLGRDAILCAPDFDPFRLTSSRYRTVLHNYFAAQLLRCTTPVVPNTS